MIQHELRLFFRLRVREKVYTDFQPCIKCGFHIFLIHGVQDKGAALAVRPVSEPQDHKLKSCIPDGFAEI